MGVVVSARRGEPGRRALRSVARDIVRDPVDRTVFALSALAVALLYTILLPYAYTQRLSFVNWQYLSVRYLAFSLAFGLGLGWLIALQSRAVRLLVRERAAAGMQSGPLGLLAAIVSVLPSLLCCSPILPTLVGFVGLSASARLSTTVTLQHFFATEENPMLLGALGLLALSALWSMRKLARAECLVGACRGGEG